MGKAFIYFLIGTAASFLLNYFILGSQTWQVDLFNAVAFGLGWGIAYFVDHPEWPLFKKLGYSFVGIILVVIIGLFLFDVSTMVPAVMRFSMVFVAYYILASFKSTKSLRIK